MGVKKGRVLILSALCALGVYLFLFILLNLFEFQNRFNDAPPVAKELWTAALVLSILVGFLGIIPYLRSNYGWVEISISSIRTYWQIGGKKFLQREARVSDIFQVHYGAVSQPFPLLMGVKELYSVVFYTPSKIAKKDVIGGTFFRTKEEAENFIRSLPFRKPTYWLTSDNKRIEFHIT